MVSSRMVRQARNSVRMGGGERRVVSGAVGGEGRVGIDDLRFSIDDWGAVRGSDVEVGGVSGAGVVDGTDGTDRTEGEGDLKSEEGGRTMDGTDGTDTMHVGAAGFSEIWEGGFVAGRLVRGLPATATSAG